MPFLLSPIANESQVDNNGDPLSGGLIETYVAGTTTPAPTFANNQGTVNQTNPIVLNVLGLPAQTIWLDSNQVYKFVIKNSTGVVQRTVDNISGIASGATPTADQWIIYPGTPTFVNATTFSVAGDQTSIFQVARRTRSIVTAGTIYSSIVTSTFAAGITTVVLLNDSGVLDPGLSQVSYGILSSVNPSIPATIPQQSYLTFTGVSEFATTGTPPTYLLTVTPPIASYVNGQRFRVKFHASGSVAAPLTVYTLNINGLGAKPIVGINGAGNGFTPALYASVIYDLEYDGTNFIVLNPLNSSSRTGEIFFWMLNSMPDYGIFCNGAALSRSQYARLFKVVGTSYGAGDGSTTFNVPNIGSFQTILQSDGSNAGVFTAGQVIAHSHGIRTSAVANIGSNRHVVDSTQPVGDVTESTGGSSNIAAGTFARVMIYY